MDALMQLAARPCFEGLQTEVWGSCLAVHDLPIEVYHSQPELSSSNERDRHKSLDLYRARHVEQTMKGLSTASTELGSDIHEWWENKDDNLSWMTRAPADMLTPTGQIGKKAREWAADNEITGRLVSEGHYWKVLRIIAALKANARAMELLEQVESAEVSLFWEHTNGMLLRTRYDSSIGGGTWLDLKTSFCDDIDKDFPNSVHKFGYGRQEAFYRLAQEAAGMEANGLIFVVVQTQEPFQVRVRKLPEDYVSACRRSVLRSLDDIHLRTELDHWASSAAEEVQELQMPLWTYPE